MESNFAYFVPAAIVGNGTWYDRNVFFVSYSYHADENAPATECNFSWFYIF